MSKKRDAAEGVKGIDRFEMFLQRYFKQLLVVIGGVIIVVIATYLVIDMKKSADDKKANYVGEAELTLSSPEAVVEFAGLSKSYPFLNDYINMVSSIYFLTSDNQTEALKFLPKITGNFKEFADAISVDLGANVDISQYITKSSMPEVWYYKEILHAEKEKQAVLLKEFETRYPESKLLELLENWGI